MKEKVVQNKRTRSAIVGSGYIADFHARAIRSLDVDLVAVCDRNIQVAKEFGRAYGLSAYSSLEEMLKNEKLHAVHILTPPDVHHSLVIASLKAGLHVLVEKPMCTSTAEADDLLAASIEADRLVRVNHNTTFGGAFERLREALRAGDLGPIDYACFNHFAELGVIRGGPFDSWMLREPGNAFLEIGSHLASQLLDLIGFPEKIRTYVDRHTLLPGEKTVFRRWRVKAEVGHTAVDVNIDLSPGFSQRAIYVRGLLGTAFVDLDANVCTIDRRTASSIDFDRFRRSIARARQVRSQAWATIVDYTMSKAKLRKRGNPYEISFLETVAAFYSELRTGVGDARISISRGRDVVDVCGRAVSTLDIQPSLARPIRQPGAPKPKMVVIGGSGFIGTRLVRKLLEEGNAVRVASRTANSDSFGEIDGDRIEIARADIRSAEDLERILEGVDQVFLLATSSAKTWPQYLEREVHPARAVANACVAHRVKRLVYTGTIDSYYAGSSAGTISEQSPLDPEISRRNYYARAKATVENLLTDLATKHGLPLVIVRPGIVIGSGGNPFHWGVGRWWSEGVCQVWGDGHNKLPLVLVDDVATGIIRASQVPNIEGRSYNLVGPPMLSARDYLEELQRIAGMRIDVHYRSIWRFYLEDLAKWPVKKLVGHPDAERIPSYRDWESRTQKALFENARARQELDWQPCQDRQRMVDEGIRGSMSTWLSLRN